MIVKRKKSNEIIFPSFKEKNTIEKYLTVGMLINTSCSPEDPTLVYVLIGYVVFLLLAATLMGFKTRDLPENFKVNFHYLRGVGAQVQKSLKHDFEITGDPKGPPSGF